VPPHRGASWLTAQPDAPVACTAPVAAVCAASPQAPAVAQDGGHGSRTEEQTGRQALERAAPTLPRQPGLVERPADASRRQGTPGLRAPCDGAPGAVGAPTIGPSRTAEDGAAPMARTSATAPEAPWLLLVAQRNRHTSEALGRLVASAWGRAAARGEKEKRGRGQSMATRAVFWSAVSHRLRCMATPQHPSGLHHSARWCSLVVRRWLRRGNFTSVEH
jgi:hypothetical protein